MRLSRKRKVAIILATAILFILFSINIWLWVIYTAVIILSVAIFVIFRLLNKLIKHTNKWKNNLAFTNQFVSNAGYRNNLNRNYDIVNVGSNPARFAFHYDNIRGENWSTGTQGLDFDLEILRYYHSYLKEGAFVLLPIVAFSSVSGYLGDCSKLYLAKFATILDSIQIRYLPVFHNIKRFLSYPLLYNKSLIKCLIKDVELDNRIQITENPLSLLQMEQDAHQWIKCWKTEFDITNINDPLPKHLSEGRTKSIKMMCDMLDFLYERGYKPVIVSPPMSESLSKYFTNTVKETYIYSFIRDLQKKYDVLYLDYSGSKELQNHEYYFNALFMNVKGRKLFTKRVLKDLGLIN